MQDETPTPRTDSAEFFTGKTGCVEADFARTLERECAELRKRLRVAEKDLAETEQEVRDGIALNVERTKSAESALSIALKERDEARTIAFQAQEAAKELVAKLEAAEASLRSLAHHWTEFGPDGMDEAIHHTIKGLQS